jgi:antitoxin component of RelBE/YafQ-DinJ toxin-antitoxin module
MEGIRPMNKTSTISIRVTKAFKDHLIKHCGQLGIEISEYVTHLILADLNKADATKGAQPRGAKEMLKLSEAVKAFNKAERQKIKSLTN